MERLRINFDELKERCLSFQQSKQPDAPDQPSATTEDKSSQMKFSLRSPLVSSFLDNDFDSHRHQSVTSMASALEMSGLICGAKFRIAEPVTSWNGCLLIYAHGYRPEEHPLTAELDVEGECYQRLLCSGWMIASTSYRRNGVIIHDAMEDIKNLRNFIVSRYQRIPNLCILEGQSMGGGICTRLAEREPGLFHGLLAIGAALMTREDKQTQEDLQQPLLSRPLIPILYLTNESEIGPIQQYINTARVHRADETDDLIIPPALWTVSRPGHNWTNQFERYSAVMSLVKWLQFGTFITVRTKDNTCPISYAPSTVLITPVGNSAVVSGEGKVLEVNLRGVLKTNFTEMDLHPLRIKSPGQKFEIEALNEIYEVTYDVYPFLHVTTGSLIAYVEPNHGYVLIGVLNVVSTDSAALRMGRVQVGDRIIFRSKRRQPGRLASEHLQIAGSFLHNRRQQIPVSYPNP
jgi:hypothetical protein